MTRGGGPSSELLETVAETAREVLRAASLSICEMTDNQSRVRVLVNVGDLAEGEERWPAEEIYSINDYPISLAFLLDTTNGASHVSVDDPEGEASEVALLKRLGKRASLNAPIVVDGTLWGSLFATRSHDQSPFTDRDDGLSEVIAALVSAGLAQARAWQAMQTLADTDPLTGVANRRWVSEHVEQCLTELAISGGSIAVAVADVNGLKRLNDTRGHAAGDEALLHVATTARHVISDVPGALAGRLGGDEFVLVLPRLAQRDVEWIASRWCQLALDRQKRISLACGVAFSDGGRNLSPGELMEAADLAQYQAKRTQSSKPVLRFTD